MNQQRACYPTQAKESKCAGSVNRTQPTKPLDVVVDPVESAKVAGLRYRGDVDSR